MTGRLNAVDLDTDLIFALLHRRRLPIGTLLRALSRVDAEPFVFDDTDRAVDQYVGYLRFFESHGLVDVDDQGVLELTENGRHMSRALEEAITDDQADAVDDALDSVYMVAIAPTPDPVEILRERRRKNVRPSYSTQGP